ncbi:DEAD/DEAH box helicase [Legionella taurinensis]|uniref:DEAD-box ATP-dependent RNA helicase RhpA n=1 Tax=Legionella taurinensis TaxID=70611 RepID=A0A3A5L6Y0_9GAMM|nr:DEAD/DEAH box helicase [Legionella taurinensis]RJT48787.1 DEAD/DEAH box helicase [Legionella taurinensis]RJT69777.1 DEAD/DEAH box helicase [Legionella taurinensis]STY24854.1 ATP-dependent RNA helicase RhlE [Legionella taurinensis]
MSFASLGLIEPLTNAVKVLGYDQPSAIQAKAIPEILVGNDLLASAQTGTGKTASFVLPILQKTSVKSRARSNRTKVLILTPTRELAAQVHESIVQYGANMSLRSAVVFGGVKINPQMMRLRAGVELLVATPGRLLDLHQQNAIHFDEVDTLVLDEADRMLDMGFIHDIKRIIKLLPEKRQNLLFSATFSDEIRKLVKGILNRPVEIEVAPRNVTADAVKQVVHPVDKGRKSELLSHLIHSKKWGQTIVFTRTKHGANKLVKQLQTSNIHAQAIHGNKSQAQRTKVLAEFKSGELHILVATDIAARGLDIDQLPCVVNYDLPQVAEDYVHRIGRTGRAGASGLAVSLVSADEINQLQSIQKLIQCKLQRKEVEGFEPEHHLPTEVMARPPVKKPNAPRRQGLNAAGRQSHYRQGKPRAGARTKA